MQESEPDWQAVMGKKVKLKGYMVISPCSRIDRNAFFIGGVASSAASETASEEFGFVVPMEGEFDQDQVVAMWQDQVDHYKWVIADQTTHDPKWRVYPRNPEKQAKHVAELMEMLQNSERELEEAKKENENGTEST